MSTPRGLSADEAAAWAKVAETVAPLRPAPARLVKVTVPIAIAGGKAAAPVEPAGKAAPRQVRNATRLTPAPTAQAPGLDSHWDRRFRAGSIEPDFTLDLHGHTLDSAHARLIDGVAQARAMGARVVLLIAGKPRPVEAADRAERRGAIRAKVLDWLAHSSHAPAIAAIRNAHIRHGGAGALYIVLRRTR